MARFGLPDIDFLEVDAEELENLAVSKFEDLQKVTLTDADPRRKFIQANVFIATLLANNIDFTGKQNLLAYAVDNHLEHLGVKKNVPRLGPIASSAIFRFEVEPPEDFTISVGTRFSINDLFFTTTEEKLVTVGMTSVDIAGECEEAGTVGNGFLPGQINSLVDPLPWVSSAYNISKTDGGVDWEEDDDYADRIRQSNAQYSTAGPEDAYRYHAMSTDASIVDVEVTSPSPGTILIVPLLKNGEIPNQEIIDLIQAKLSNKQVRPLTDYVTVEQPEEISYDIDVTYYVSSDKSNVLPDVQTSVNQAIADYQIWQKNKLGRGIDPSELISLIKASGAKRVSVTSPSSFVALNKNQVAKSSAISVTFGGIEDD